MIYSYMHYYLLALLMKIVFLWKDIYLYNLNIYYICYICSLILLKRIMFISLSFSFFLYIYLNLKML